ncbi:hypothetical protein [Novosphingobium sp.]|uniref:hypothetical protein n=1 Tax=Novosphingobium sp. TaxID=1874826 RepID=UPI0025F3BD6C|nr:hypothetical protein [Novosphingobium sp.]MCC6924482.1 hypothetical protein [Novosphingobium sp.]
MRRASTAPGNRLWLAAGLLALAGTIGPAEAIGVRRPPALGPPVTVRVELVENDATVIDQVVSGLVRRMGHVTVERDLTELRPCPLGGRTDFVTRFIHEVELGLQHRLPEQGGLSLKLSVRRQTNPLSAAISIPDAKRPRSIAILTGSSSSCL